MAGPDRDGVIGRPPLGSPRSRIATERRRSTSLAPTAFSPGQAIASADEPLDEERAALSSSIAGICPCINTKHGIIICKEMDHVSVTSR